MDNKDKTFLLERRAALLKQQFDMMEQIQEIDRLLEEKKWNPIGGDWWITSNSDIVPATTSINCEMATLFGTRRPTKEQAERAAVEMRKYNRLLALKDELCGYVDEGNWSYDDKKYYYVYYDHYYKRYDCNSNNHAEYISVYFSTKEHAQKACYMLNSGEVVL
jgi:hypothetical protein